MAVTRERFNLGKTYDEFKQGVRNRDAFESTEGMLALSEADLAPFWGLRDPLDVLVIVTETCPDVVMNVPILARIAKETGKLNVRIFMRDDNRDLMAQYMNGPYESVPVFAFFDPSWTELGAFIERPPSVTDLRQQKTQEIYDLHPEFGTYGSSPSELPEEIRGRLNQAIRQMREDTGQAYARETIRELGNIAREIGHGAAAGLARRWGNLAAVPA